MPPISLCSTGKGIPISENADGGCSVAAHKSLEGKYVWDKNILTSEQYEKQFCGKTCVGQELRTPSDSCQHVECFDCMCDRPTCEIYGICCPENEYVNSSSSLNGKRATSDVTMTNTESKNLGDFTDGKREGPLELPMLKCETSEDGKETYLYIQSCPNHFKDLQTRDLCEQERDPEKDVTLDQFARVTDVKTRVTYYNKYCAICNGVAEKQIVQWNVTIDCEHFLYVYGATTFDQLLSYSLRPDSACAVQQDHLVEYLTPCTPKWFREKSVSSCNETGLWQIQDDDVENACQQMNGRSHSVYLKQQRGSHRLFKNIFCAICNMANYPDCGTHSQVFGPVGPFLAMSHVPISGPLLIGLGQGPLIIPSPPLPTNKRQLPFKLILGFHRKKTKPVYESTFTFSSCKNWQWASPDGLCLELHCSPGKVPSNGTCITALTQIRGLGYRFNMWFEPDSIAINRTEDITENRYFSEQYLAAARSYFHDQITSQLNASYDNYEITLKVISSSLEGKNEDTQRLALKPLVALWLQVMVTANRSIPRDEFEMQLISFIRSLARDTHLQLALNPRSNLGETDPSSLCSRTDLKCNSTVISHCDTKPICAARAGFLKAEESVACQFVQFNRSQYAIEKSQHTTSLIPSTKLSIRLGATTLVFKEERELTSVFLNEENILQVCRDLLDMKLKKLEEERQRQFYAKHRTDSTLSTVEKAQYCLTLVCLSASMICLSLTLLTYFSFKVLRNQAGLNNIFLCGSLLMAQTFLLTSSHVTGPDPLCTMLGMLTHFLWLWMFVWSFICCFHMFRVFTVNTVGINATRWCCSQSSRLLYTVLLSLACPVCIVSLVIFISLAKSGGTRSGYGRDFCYLDSNLLAGLTTVLPVALVTVSNIVFFTITVVKIHRTRKLQSHEFCKKGDKTNFFVYVKLSSITGCFWLLNILAEGLDNDVLRFIAIVTNGLQGVFIFVSYICNKRVYHLYAKRLGIKDTTSTTTCSNSKRQGTGQQQVNHHSSSNSSCSSTDRTVTSDSNTESTI
ncbi:adhesion G protein-coupled receptor L3 [Elysia marginata]|uniref:Adhesion G protein-coupled receptor L3 n=1 Tax=Elysia marginata TaxID=1093978 RepID=A0AAV4H9U8_9GAST|nr:adhesion G protein-coupled receptor L3 [Elysia marginata]